jgi:hypothetical protein
MNDDLIERLPTLERSFREVEEDDTEDFYPEVADVPQMSESEYGEHLARRAVTPFGRMQARLREIALEELIPALEEVDASERQRLTDAIEQSTRVSTGLWRLLGEYRWRLEKAPYQEKPALLRTFLRLAVLIQRLLDEFETGSIVADAWQAAEHAGLDPVPYFEEAAQLAGDVDLGNGRTAKQVLLGFNEENRTTSAP